ncbi:MAG: recombinase family protein [Chloroflexota bacterium]|nr:recombinase family protein [Chloroflexota bacterium]
MSGTEKITSWHLGKRAYIYIRQSDPRQVRQNLGSQYNQYALVERAVELGWLPDKVHIIDDDQGHSSLEPGRQGFQELVGEVGLERVGIVLTYEASRLARSNSDWYRLLDIAALVGTLIADADGIYDPREYNDRMLLGLRGMLSEAETHLLKLRLAEGRMRRVERGEYRQHLPTGLVRLEDGQVVKHPDVEVQHAIELVLERFEALGSARQVLRSLRADGVLLPRYQTSGFHAGQLLWKLPSESTIYEILQNPAYAGAFVYGRRPLAPNRKGTVRRPVQEWPVICQGVYPEYISWERYLANQQRLRENGYRYAELRMGAVREGGALLAGLVVCGRCGHKMHLDYKGQGRRPRYYCNGMLQDYAGATCQYLNGEPIEQVVVGAFFEAIRPAELDLLDEVLKARQEDRERTARQHAEQVKRAEYEAQLAERQYRKVDPDNRLVAAELERRWELALRELAGARETVERFDQQPPDPELDPKLREQLADLGKHLPELWESGKLGVEHKKALLRSLISQVILHRVKPDTVEVRLVWISGAVSRLVVHPPIHRVADMSGYDQLVERLLELSEEGYPDAAIAERLTQEGFRSARSEGIPKSLVVKLRHRHGHKSLLRQLTHREKVDGNWTVYGLARELGVDRSWIYIRIRSGSIPAAHYRQSGCYVIEDDPELISRLRELVSTQQKRRS